MIPMSMRLDAGRGVIFTTDGFDGASIEVVWSSGATSAVLEARPNYTGRIGDGVSYGTPATLSAGTTRREAMDVQDAPYLEVIVTTAAAGERAQLNLYRYARSV